MTAVSAPTFSRREKRRRVHPFWNLIRKEAVESRGLLVTGLWSFWLMPAVLGIAYALYDELMPGFAWGVVAVAGWFYAVVVAAQCVCRDWGKDEERFLLAKPVSAAQVVLAKLVVGAGVFSLVMFVSCLWDLGAWSLSDYPSMVGRHEQQVLPTMALLLICLWACSFLISFASAVITGQLLSSMLITILALITWVAAHAFIAADVSASEDSGEELPRRRPRAPIPVGVSRGFLRNRCRISPRHVHCWGVGCCKTTI